MNIFIGFSIAIFSLILLLAVLSWGASVYTDIKVITWYLKNKNSPRITLVHKHAYHRSIESLLASILLLGFISLTIGLAMLKIGG